MEQISYTAAMSELEGILSALRSDKCDVDTLTERTRRAVELLKICRSRLTTTEEELGSILESLKSTDPTTD